MFDNAKESSHSRMTQLKEKLKIVHQETHLAWHNKDN